MRGEAVESINYSYFFFFRCFGETLSTLNFARRAKMIKNKAVMNEDVTGNVRELQLEIKKLKEQLAQARGNENTVDYVCEI